MSFEQVINSLLARFSEGKRIIFWYDEEAEFEDFINDLSLEEIKIINLKSQRPFETKYLIEVLEPNRQFLVYSPSKRPQPEKDWLLDIFLYSYEFSADKATMIRDELGLVEPRMRHFIREYQAFFNAKRRKEELGKIIQPTDSESSVLLKMLQVVTGAPSNNIDDILLVLYENCFEEQSFQPSILDELEKFDLKSPFWSCIYQTYAYPSPDKEGDLKEFLFFLAVTELFILLGNEIPAPLKHFVIPYPQKANHALVLLSRWRDSQSFQEAYLWALEHVAEDPSLR